MQVFFSDSNQKPNPWVGVINGLNELLVSLLYFRFGSGLTQIFFKLVEQDDDIAIKQFCGCGEYG